MPSLTLGNSHHIVIIYVYICEHFGALFKDIDVIYDEDASYGSYGVSGYYSWKARNYYKWTPQNIIALDLTEIVTNLQKLQCPVATVIWNLKNTSDFINMYSRW